MIIQCESCDTRFRLDESRIPAKGARVRCSRCKTAFFVAHPNASREDAVADIVADAAAPGAPAGPGTTQDLFDPTGNGADDAAASEKTLQGRPALPADDEQWTFEDAAQAPAQEAAPTAAAPPSVAPPPAAAENVGAAAAEALAETADPSALDLDPGPDSSEDIGLDPMAGPDPTPAVTLAPPAPGPVLEDPDDWGGIDASMSPTAAAEPPARDTREEAPGDSRPPMTGPSFDASGVSDDTPGPVEPSDDAPGEDSLFDGFGSDLGDATGDLAAASADFAGSRADFAGSRADFAGSSADFAGSSADLDEASNDFAGASAHFPDAAPSLDRGDVADADEEFVEAGPMAAARPPRRNRPSLGKVLNHAAWAAAAAMLCVGMVLSLVPSVPPAPIATQGRDVPLPYGGAVDVRGRFVDNAWTGPLFIVSGTYAPVEAPPGVMTLRLTWLDADGKSMPSDADSRLVAGAAFAVPDLRQINPAALAELALEAAPDFIRGGPFDIIVPAVPEGAADFALEVQVAPFPVQADAEGEDGAQAPGPTAYRRPILRPSSA